MWRDTVRRQLNFARLKVDFLTVHVSKVEGASQLFEEAEETLVHNNQNMEAAASGTDILGLLGQEASVFTFRYPFQVVDTEGEGLEYEYQGASLAIDDNVASAPKVSPHEI